jgi:hypothetical protein
VSTFKTKYKIVDQPKNGKSLKIQFDSPDLDSAGINFFRLIGVQANSSFHPIAVDLLENQMASPDKPLLVSPFEKPVAVWGTLSGQQKSRIFVKTKKNLRFVVEVEARRLGSSLRPDLRILDSAGNQLAWATGIRTVHGDTRVHFQAPFDGDFEIQIHDVLLKAPANSIYRVKVGDFEYSDQIFPATLPSTSPPTFVIKKISAPKIPTNREIAGWHPTLSANGMFTGTRPSVHVGDHSNITENELAAIGSNKQKNAYNIPADKIPLTIDGVISRKNETDTFVLSPTSTPTTIVVEAQAAQINSPLDPVIVVKNAAGKMIKTGDDMPQSLDAKLTFSIPANSKSHKIELRDLLNRGGEHFTYRLRIADQLNAPFEIRLANSHFNLVPGSTTLIKANIQRNGNAKPIRIEFPQLPDGVTANTVNVAPDTSVAFLSLSAKAKFKPSFVQIVGKQESSGHHAAATASTTPVLKQVPWARQLITVSPAKPSNLIVELRPLRPSLFWPRLYQTSAKIDQVDKKLTSVQLRLETTQNVPTKKVKNKNVPDKSRQLAIATTDVTLKPDETEKSFLVYVPKILEKKPVQMVLVAQSLQANKDPKQKQPVTGPPNYSNVVESPVWKK